MTLERFSWLDASELAPFDVMESGWRVLIERALSEIDVCIKDSSTTLRLIQVKEKFGSLRINYRLEDADEACAEQVKRTVRWAMRASTRLCFCCGKPGSLHDDGWIIPLCNEHAVSDFRSILRRQPGSEPDFC